MISFADELSCYRKEKGISQNDLAKAISYDRSYISRLENGERAPTDRNVVVKIADYFNSDIYLRNKLLILANFEPELNTKESYKSCLKLIDEFKSKGLLDKAKSIVSSIKSSSDNKFDYSIILAYSHLIEKNYQKAIELYQEAIDNYEENIGNIRYKLALTKAEVIHNLGNVYFEKGLELKKEFENSRSSDSLAKNIEKECLDNLFIAVEHFNSALLLQPSHYHIVDQLARINLNISSLKTGDEKVIFINQAINYYHKLLEMESDDKNIIVKKLEASMYIALCYARINKFNEAKILINTVVSMNVINPQCHYIKALIYSLDGKSCFESLKTSFEAVKNAINLDNNYIKRLETSIDLTNLKNSTFFQNELIILSKNIKG